MHLIKEKARRAATVYGKNRESQQYQDHPSQRKTRRRAREASQLWPLLVPLGRTAPDLSPEAHDLSSSHDILQVRGRNRFLLRPGVPATQRETLLKQGECQPKPRDAPRAKEDVPSAFASETFNDDEFKWRRRRRSPGCTQCRPRRQKDFRHPALNSADGKTHFGQHKEPGPLFLRFTWDKKVVTAATLERFIAVGTIFTSRWLSWRVGKFLRNNSHADVYSVTYLEVSDPTVTELITTRVHHLPGMKNTIELEAHVFVNNVGGNWRTYASRYMKRLENDGSTLDNLHWVGRRVLIRQVPSKHTSFKLVNSQTEFPSLPTQKGSTKAKYSRQRQHPRQFSYAHVLSKAIVKQSSGKILYSAPLQLIFEHHLKHWMEEQQKRYVTKEKLETATKKRGEKQKRKRQAKRGERRARKLSAQNDADLEKASEVTIPSHTDVVGPLILPGISETQDMRESVSLVNAESMRDLKFVTLGVMPFDNNDRESHRDGRNHLSTQADLKLADKGEPQPSETEVAVSIESVPSADEHLYAEDVDGMLSGLVEVESSEIDPESPVDRNDKHKSHKHEPKEGQDELANADTDLPAQLDMVKEAEGPEHTALREQLKSPTKKPWTPPTRDQVEKDLSRPLDRSSNINEKRESLKKAFSRQSKAVKLNDFRKFSQTFKLKTPVPLDLVPILAKDKVKQQRIVSAALQAAENPSRAISDTKNVLGVWYVAEAKDKGPESGRKKRNANRLLKYGKKKGLKVSREPTR